MEKTEGKIQQEIVSWFNNSFCLAHHNPRSLILSIPNGGERNVQEAMKSRATGEYAGASDLLVIHFGKVIFVEVKDEKGTQKPKQIEFQKHVESMGFPYYIVRSLEEFKELINSI